MRFAYTSFLMLVALLASAQSVSAVDDADINDAVARLSDPDAAVRDKASAALWQAGKAAEPALRKALASDDPEVVRRARSVLVRFELGLYPDSPADILELVGNYRNGNNVARWTAVHALANRGNRGLRVLLGLRRLAPDEASRSAILRAIGASPHQHSGAQLVLAEGDFAGAAELLRHDALEGDPAVRDYAALLFLHGGLDVQIAAADAKLNPGGAPGKRVVYLTRAKGDLAGAIKAADESDETELVDALLMEARDWKRLALRYHDRPGSSSETLGFTAEFCRFTGDADGVERAAAGLRSYADQHEEEYWNCAECLMLNDRVDEGVAVLLSHKDYLGAIDFLLARLRLKEALALIPKAKADLKPAEALRLRARAISVYRYIGDRESAERELRDVATENEKEKDRTTWIRLSSAAREMKRPRLADKFLAAAISLVAAGAESDVLEKADLPEGFPAFFWWQFLRLQHMTEPYEQTLGRLRDLATGKLSSEEVDALTEAARKSAALASQLERGRWIQAIGQTFNLLGRRDEAEKCFQELVGMEPTYASLELLGDCEASRGDFSKAAGSYYQAWDLDRTRPAPLALDGWALLHCGRERDGRDAIDRAHLLPLGDEVQRTRLEELFRAHDLPDDAARERELIIRTGQIFSWEVCNAHRLNGDAQEAHGDPGAAADSWDLAFLRNVRKDTNFIVPVVNASVPAMIHKARALSLVKTAPDKALAEAKLAMTDTPQDADVLIELVQAFEKAGHKAEADAIFEPGVSIYRHLCEDFPASGPAHNELAWADGRCRRNLDEALAHAKRSVELDPDNAESVDTLAEVHFGRGELAEAITAAQRCVELNPKFPHYREQLEKLKAAGAGSRK
jgi:tetratricopeptide (TPR) repeat protein